MLKDIPSQKGKYSELELELKAKTAIYPEYKDLKNSVINSDAAAYLGYLPIPQYRAVADKLRLNAKAKEELKDLYSEVIEPMRSGLHSLRSRIITTRSWFGILPIASPAKGHNEAEVISATSGFSESFFRLMERGNVYDKKEIKRAIIYPLTISVISSWDRYNGKFTEHVDGLIGAIKAHEGDPELKNAIDVIHNPARRRVSIRF
ncbi:MAG: hypothetical protein KGI06_01625 [Candidatus Micrarchaeota archaeon]|nr:hypothetical protein [Candidatus Micrarchaeota archaeon]